MSLPRRQTENYLDEGLITESHGTPPLRHLQVENVEIGVGDDDVDDLALPSQVAQPRHCHPKRSSNADAAVKQRRDPIHHPETLAVPKNQSRGKWED